jgi:PiT family inorganic phosphate transporter
MAVILNFLGVLVMTFVNSEVAETISNMVTFGEETGAAQIALAAALFSIVVWSVGAWYFGIPTSESHSLIAGITGSALAMGGIGAVNMAEWSKVLIGLVISSIIGFGGGYGVAKLIQKIFTHVNRRSADTVFTFGQALSAAANAFLHGAQDGQKFMGVFMLTLFYNGMVDRNAAGAFTIPLWVMVLCSLVMGLGTSVGGMKIIKAVGMDMVKLEKYQGFSADLSAAVCLLGSSLLGIPVSTTHTKTTAIMGVGAARRIRSVDWSIVKEMVLAWILTFPGCGIIAYLMTKLFIHIF